MANLYRSVLALALLTGSSSLLAFEITGETFSVEGTVTGVELTADGGTINAVGNAGRYGKVFLTWNMTLNPNSDSQGAFTGRGMGIDDDGNREAGSRYGVWRRSGTTVTTFSLDDVTDGNQNLCRSTIDLHNNTFTMTFYPLPK